MQAYRHLARSDSGLHSELKTSLEKNSLDRAMLPDETIGMIDTDMYNTIFPLSPEALSALTELVAADSSALNVRVLIQVSVS